MSASRIVAVVLSSCKQQRDELLEREIFDTLNEAKLLVERWRRQNNTVRPHNSLGYQPPAPAAAPNP